MKRIGLELLGLLAVVVLAASLVRMEQKARHAGQQVSIWQARYASEASKAGPVAETVRVRADGVRVLRDTLLQHLTDTFRVKEYIYQTDTLRVVCELCAQRLLALRNVSDSTIGELRDALNRERSRLWKGRFGLFVGYGQGWGQNDRGLLAGVGLRIFP